MARASEFGGSSIMTDATLHVGFSSAFSGVYHDYDWAAHPEIYLRNIGFSCLVLVEMQRAPIQRECRGTSPVGHLPPSLELNVGGRITVSNPLSIVIDTFDVYAVHS